MTLREKFWFSVVASGGQVLPGLPHLKYVPLI